MILVPTVRLTRMRIEEVIACGQLEGKARGAPDISGIVVGRTQQHLDRAVLARLYVLGEMMVLQSAHRTKETSDNLNKLAMLNLGLLTS